MNANGGQKHRMTIQFLYEWTVYDIIYYINFIRKSTVRNQYNIMTFSRALNSLYNTLFLLIIFHRRTHLKFEDFAAFRFVGYFRRCVTRLTSNLKFRQSNIIIYRANNERQTLSFYIKRATIKTRCFNHGINYFEYDVYYGKSQKKKYIYK